MKLAGRRTFIGVTLVVTVMFFGTALAYEHWSSEGWYEQSIDDVTHSGYNVATALDPSGRMHVVYFENGNDYIGIKHAVRSGGTWEISTITQVASDISDLEMAIGEDSVVRVSWWDSPKINYATNAGGEFEVVSAEIEEPYGVAMAIDHLGDAHALVTTRHLVDSYPSYIVYQHEYWAISSGEWVLVQTYDAPEQTGDQYVQELVVDGRNDPCALIWFMYNFTSLPYHYLASTFLGDSPLEFQGIYINSDTTLMDAEYDSVGQIHLLIRDGSHEPSVLLHWAGDGLLWDHLDSETIDYAGDSESLGADLFIDSQDDVFVAYSSFFSAFSTRQCEVAERSEEGWTINALRESGSTTWMSPSLVCDSEGVYHVAAFVFDGIGPEVTITYANSDGHEVLMQSLSDAAMYTVIAVVIGWPTAFAFIRWQELRRADREKRASMELYDEQLRKAP